MRIALVLAIVAYVSCFEWMYKNYLYPMWGYFGFDYNAPSSGSLLLAWTLSVAPSIWMPLKLTRPSQLAYWVLYLTVIIPSMFVPLFVGLDRQNEILVLMVVLFAGFGLAGSSYLIPLFEIRSSTIQSRTFWRGFWIVAIVLAVWMILVFRNHVQLVSFLGAYDLRYSANDVAEGSQVNYAFMLLSGAVDPFLLACGLYYRRMELFMFGALGQLLVYVVGGTKGSILSLIFIPCFFVILNKAKRPFGITITLALLVLIGGMCTSYYAAGYDPGVLHSIALFVVLMRLLSINGLLTAEYYNFFQSHPVTYLSNIKGISLFVPYPYKFTIGQEIGLAFSGTTDLDATAHFWATDGIGGLGLSGIIVISIVCAVVFWIVDSFARHHDARFAALVITYAAYNLSNISIFTTLFSGGLGLLALLLYLMPPGAPVRASTARIRASVPIRGN